MGIDIKSAFQSMFPFINAALSVGGLPGAAAAQVIGKLIGVDHAKVTVETAEPMLVEASATKPEILAQMQEAEHAFELEMAQRGYDSVEKLAALGNQDRDSARSREIAVKDKTPQWLAYGDGLAFLAAFIVLLAVHVPADIHDLLLIMVTVLGTNVTNERQYYFGSSSGSAAKTEIMAKK